MGEKMSTPERWEKEKFDNQEDNYVEVNFDEDD